MWHGDIHSFQCKQPLYILFEIKSTSEISYRKYLWSMKYFIVWWAHDSKRCTSSTTSRQYCNIGFFRFWIRLENALVKFVMSCKCTKRKKHDKWTVCVNILHPHQYKIIFTMALLLYFERYFIVFMLVTEKIWKWRRMMTCLQIVNARY